jgi:hypothetical protein
MGAEFIAGKIAELVRNGGREAVDMSVTKVRDTMLI